MSSPPMDVYGRGLLDAEAGACIGDWLLRYSDGSTVPLALRRWMGGLKPGDHGLLDRCAGVTLDVGCGPGRLTAGVAARGGSVLGLDIAPVAVRLTRARGVSVLLRSVFDRVPREGQWDRILLADGNMGIGGDPVRLLRRCHELAAPDGAVITEQDPPGRRSGPVRMRIESSTGIVSSWFPWAHVADDQLAEIADEAGLVVTERWSEHDRFFAALRRTAER